MLSIVHHPTTRHPLEPQSVTHVATAQIHLSQPRENAHHPPPGHLRRQVRAHGHDSRCGKTLQFFPPSHHAVLAISLMRIRGPLVAFFFIKKGGAASKAEVFSRRKAPIQHQNLPHRSRVQSLLHNQRGLRFGQTLRSPSHCSNSSGRRRWHHRRHRMHRVVYGGSG